MWNQHFQMNKVDMVESQIKGKKVDDWKPELSRHLNNSTKICFFDNKSPKIKGCYILPPTVFGTFFEREKVVRERLRSLIEVASWGSLQWLLTHFVPTQFQ